MKQLRQIKIYSFNRLQVSDGVISTEYLDECNITLTDSFLMFALEKYLGVTFANGQLVAELIKVMLPFNEEEE